MLYFEGAVTDMITKIEWFKYVNFFGCGSLYRAVVAITKLLVVIDASNHAGLLWAIRRALVTKDLPGPNRSNQVTDAALISESGIYLVKAGSFWPENLIKPGMTRVCSFH